MSGICISCTPRVLERIGARALVAHVRTFADFLVYEFSTSAGGQQLNKCIEILNDMVWKYNIVTLDRLILCLVSRKDLNVSPACRGNLSHVFTPLSPGDA